MNDGDQIRRLARVILRLNVSQLTYLQQMLKEESGGDPAGVGAVIPPNLPLKEGGAEVPFEEWPDEYWESQA